TYPSSARTSRRPTPALRFRSTNLSRPSIRNSRASPNDVSRAQPGRCRRSQSSFFLARPQYLLGYALENEAWPGPTISVVAEIGPPHRSRSKRWQSDRQHFIIRGPQSVNVIVRGIGPSLASRLPQTLPDTSLELHNTNGALMQSNTGWAN